MVIAFASFGVSASGLYLDYQSQDISFDHFSPTMTGAAVGYSWGDNRKFYLEGELLNDSELNFDYWGATIGFNKELVQYEKTYLAFNLGLGFSQLDVPSFENKNNLLSIPVGVTGGYKLSDNVSIDASIGYRYFIDLTENTKCKDGSTSDSVGSGTCSWHGGIAQYQDQIGDGGGVYYRAGLRYSF